MFTGIIEAFGEVSQLIKDQSNLHIQMKSSLASALQVDQSLAHNGLFTVVAQDNEHYTVTAIQETLEKTNLGTLEVGNLVNLERAMLVNARLDGHLVQGHVDQTALCTDIENEDVVGAIALNTTRIPTILPLKRINNRKWSELDGGGF